MSWLSHFTGWVGEKKNAILPIVTGLAGFAAGMVPGIGGAVQKQIDKWGSKISGASDALDMATKAGDLISPQSPIISAVQVPQAPTTVPPELLGNAAAPRTAAPAAGKSNTPLLIGGGILAFLLLGGNRR